MKDKLIVTDQVEINAPTEKVWEVLTNPKFIKQWDEIPENFGDNHLSIGSVIKWEGYSEMTVTEFVQERHLRLSLYLPNIELKPTDYDVSYSYFLEKRDGRTLLAIEIGDFSPLPNGRRYFDASIEFAASSKQKIKELSEQ